MTGFFSVIYFGYLPYISADLFMYMVKEVTCCKHAGGKFENSGKSTARE